MRIMQKGRAVTADTKIEMVSMSRKEIAPSIVDEGSIGLNVKPKLKIRRTQALRYIADDTDRFVVVGGGQKQWLSRVPADHKAAVHVAAAKDAGKNTG